MSMVRLTTAKQRSDRKSQRKALQSINEIKARLEKVEAKK